MFQVSIQGFTCSVCLGKVGGTLDNLCHVGLTDQLYLLNVAPITSLEIRTRGWQHKPPISELPERRSDGQNTCLQRLYPLAMRYEIHKIKKIFHPLLDAGPRNSVKEQSYYFLVYISSQINSLMINYKCLGRVIGQIYIIKSNYKLTLKI